MKVRESWVSVKERLSGVGIDDAGLESEVLVRHALRSDRAQFFASLEDVLAPRSQQRIERLLQLRTAREPLAYILGFREFYGLDIHVNPTVLVPRQETELLVDGVLGYARKRRDQPLLIADVGTGSGAIAVAVAVHVPSATVYATDTSRGALEVADVNRRRHGVSNNVHLLSGDLLEPLPAPVDVVVCNLPYLDGDEMATLPPEVRREPPSALNGGGEGLQVIRRLLREAPSYLRPGGLLLVEIGPDQLEPVLRLGRESFPTAAVSFDRDLSGLPRVVSIENT